MAILIDNIDDIITDNPLDVIADMLLAYGVGITDRPPHQLLAEIDSSWATYKLRYQWNKLTNILSFTCSMELALNSSNHGKLYPLLMQINTKLPIGHFIINEATGNVEFCYNMLFTEQHCHTAMELEIIVDTAIAECDRCYLAAQAIIWHNKTAQEALSLALFDIVGEA